MQTAPVIDLSSLPSAQRAVVQALLEEVTALKEITRRQEHLIAELNHALHGKRSEKLSEDARQLAFEDLSIALAEVEAAKEKRAAKSGDGMVRPAPKRTIGNLPATLPRIEEVIEPDSLICPCGCGVMHKIGEDRTERLDIVPAQLRVIVTVRPKYACRTCTDGVTQAAAPSHLVMSGLPTEATLAHVLVNKYADHLPLYRQSQILARAGLDLHRAVLADWVGKAAFHLKPVVDRLAYHMKRSGKLFMDETTAPVLDPGRGTTKTGYLWALARDDRPWGGEDPPGVVYFYAPGRAGENAETFLTGFDGILQIDGYTGYNRLIKPSRKGGAPFAWPIAGRMHGANSTRSLTATVPRSLPKDCVASPSSMPSRPISAASPLARDCRLARPAPRHWWPPSVTGSKRSVAKSLPSPGWAKNWPISITTGMGCKPS
jgi:transposase